MGRRGDISIALTNLQVGQRSAMRRRLDGAVVGTVYRIAMEMVYHRLV